MKYKILYRLKSIICFGIYGICAICFIISGNSQADIWLIDPLESTFPDRNQTKKWKKNLKSDFPLGVPIQVQLVTYFPVGSKISISARMQGQVFSTKYWAQLIDVPVEQNTGLDSRTEQFTNQVNPHVIRRAPFNIYEAIQPLSQNSITTSSPFHAFLLQIPFLELPQPDYYSIEIFVMCENGTFQAQFDVTVHNVRVPSVAEGNFFYTNWFNLKRMEEKHSLERWSSDWFNMLDRYASLMAHGRQNCVIIPGELIFFEDDRFVLDEIRMLEFINVFRNRGFQYFESPHLLYRGDDDDWSDPELKVILTKNGFYTDAGKRDIRRITELIREFTRKNDLTNHWLQHVADEPTAVNAACYGQAVRLIKSIYPEIQIMEATNDRDGIIGAIDLWCPLINDFQENESFFRSREKEGEKVLVYTCLIPGGKWLNRTMDMEKIRQVYFGWGAAFYNTFGYLHWGLNQYYADPFEQSVIHHPSPVATANNFLPAGDTHVIYPGEEGPLSSMRFEAHRIGIEDFEILQLAKKKNEKKTQKLISKLFSSYTAYELSLKKYRKTKRALLNYVAS